MHGLLATLFFVGLSRAASVFLSPPESLPSLLSPQQANLVLTAHLGLEQFEVVDQLGRLNHLLREREFVAQGDQNALLLLVDEEHALGGWPESLVPLSTYSTQTSSRRRLSHRSPSLSPDESHCRRLSRHAINVLRMCTRMSLVKLHSRPKASHVRWTSSLPQPRPTKHFWPK